MVLRHQDEQHLRDQHRWQKDQGRPRDSNPQRQIPSSEHWHRIASGTQEAPIGIKNDIANLLNTATLDKITDQIETGLSGLHQFILPGNGTFAMCEPKFNN